MSHVEPSKGVLFIHDQRPQRPNQEGKFDEGQALFWAEQAAASTTKLLLVKGGNTVTFYRTRIRTVRLDKRKSDVPEWARTQSG